MLHGEVRDFFADPGALTAAREAGQVVATASSHDKGRGRIGERHIKRKRASLSTATLEKFLNLGGSK